MSTRPIGSGAGAAVRRATATLAAAGVASPDHDARVLAEHVLGRRGLLASFDGGTMRRFEALVARRAAREPLQHLTGMAPFRYLELAVGPGVFVPRPETEGLVDLVLSRCGPDRVAVDLCAGSGAIALALATERPGTTVHAVELSPDALPWLARNAGGLVSVHHADIRTWRPELVADVVVSNPPYLPTGPQHDPQALDPEVADYDPAAALWGGEDGLAVIGEVIATAADLLAVGGLVALEHDARHQPAVLECLRRSGFGAVAGHQDLTGRPRYATGVRMSP